MKKNKIAIFTTVILLAVGTVFGASKLHKKDTNPYFYITGTPGVCTAISCSAMSGSPYCVTVSTVFYKKNTGGVCSDVAGTGLKQAF